jgi:amino acid transporter
VLKRLRSILLGGPKNLFDPRIFHSLALIAFFAWVGLGSDGLSSSAYGPEETFLQLGRHRYLALYLMVAMVATVFLISASYRQIVELFPTGGGGYLVATKLLGPVPGIIAGGSLVVDYVLTISISVASGCDAVYSFLPPAWNVWKVPTAVVAILLLTGLNMRGVRESISVLIPIFLSFMISHVVLISYGILSHAGQMGPVIASSAQQTQESVASLGAFAVFMIFFKAYSLGGGTYTGIEAVSNSTNILREPKVETGKRTMLYMAISLAFTAGGILLCYLLWDVQHETGRTLNASLWSLLTNGWNIGGLDIGPGVVWFTLISEGALLFVAAQTGFVAGPSTLAAMALDGWVPKRFAHLSERLVTQNGVITMGLAAVSLVVYTGGAVSILVVMYSINVFIAFTLTQAGMVRHWWTMRLQTGHWKRRLTVALVGTTVTGFILALTAVLKFTEGVWVSLLVTGAFIAASFAVRAHYRSARRMLRTLDEIVMDLPLPTPKGQPQMSPQGPTGIVLVEKYDGLGIHTLLSIQRMLPGHFKNLVFATVGLVDSGQFKGVEHIEALEKEVRTDLEKFVDLATRMGYYADFRYRVGTDLIEELEDMCLGLTREYRRCVVCAGQLVFERETLFTRTLHHETSFSIQRRLQFAGVQVIIFPIRVWRTRGSG